MLRWKATVLMVCICGMSGLLLAHLPARGGQTQMEMNQTAANDYKKADARLNQVYRKLMPVLDAPTKAKLKAAQTAWIKFRDAESAFRASEVEGGSAYPADYAGYMTTLTQHRTRELQDAYKAFSQR
jgi:uncharacterized protein YecT (DUF1311 family)